MNTTNHPQESKLPVLIQSILLALVFTVALTFATVEIPWILSALLEGRGVVVSWELMRVVRPIGYACLATVIILIIAGFIIERKNLSSLGVIFFFLPIFGYFVFTMWGLLIGLGILRIAWIPFSENNLMMLGDIVYLPYMIPTYIFYLMGLDIRRPLAIMITGLGLFIFLLGTVTWLYGKVEKRETIRFWIYRYSRHPQYLGYIIWSYGVMLLGSRVPIPYFGGENPGAGLPWLISSLIVVCIALAEENAMSKKDRDTYLKYKEGTPFMFPIPKFVNSLVTAPIRIMFGKNWPENKKEIVGTFTVYCLIFILLSLPFAFLNWPSGPQWDFWPYPYPWSFSTQPGLGPIFNPIFN